MPALPQRDKHGKDTGRKTKQEHDQGKDGVHGYQGKPFNQEIQGEAWVIHSLAIASTVQYGILKE